MKLPAWLPPLSARDERLRAAHGLTPKRDGWHKSVDGKTCYIAKPMPVPTVAALLPDKLAAIRARRAGDALPAVPAAAMTLDQLVDLFLARMLTRVRTGVPKPMKRRTYDDYADTLSRFAEAVGGGRVAASIGPADFTRFAETFAARAASTRRREIQYVDRLFNWAGPGRRSMNLIPPVNCGPDWVKPSDDEIGAAAADSDKAYTVEQVREVFDRVKDDPTLNAWAHLGLNCGFNAMDVATLPESAVDLGAATIVFARGKTGVGRLCPLVPETVNALRAYLAFRAKRNSCREEARPLFFRTHQGFGYYRVYVDADDPAEPGYEYNRVTKHWTATVRRPFTGLRSAFATLADDWADQRAIDVVMGHKVGHTGRSVRSVHYAKRFNPERARRLVEHVWRLVFPASADTPPPSLG